MPGAPDHLFLLNPPSSGSTALARTLLTSARLGAIEPNAEGYRHPYTLDLMERRWQADKVIDWTAVREQWLRAWSEQHEAKPTADIMLEKSPPNIIRALDIQAAFPGASFVIWSRDPYAMIASLRRRYGHGLARSAGLWLRCARANLDNRRELERSVTFTYERFSAEPAQCLERLRTLFPQLSDIDPGKPVQVKDYDPQPWRDLNADQVGLLDPADFAEINAVLAPGEDLLAQFGYRLREAALDR